MSATNTLHLQNLCADISKSLALENINLCLQAGEVTAIIGPNGAGKTSLLRAICAELSCSAGSAELNAKAMLDWDLQQRAKILAILPQRSTLEFPFTVREVVTLGRIPHSTSHQLNQEIVSSALELVDCAQFSDRIYVNLSGGEKQRVQLARVAAQIWEAQQDNRCLILDEPSASLDLAHQALIVDMIHFFARQGVAVLTVLHDLNLASKCADQIFVMEAGREVAKGHPEDVLTEELLASTFGIKSNISTNSIDGSRLVIT